MCSLVVLCVYNKVFIICDGSLLKGGGGEYKQLSKQLLILTCRLNRGGF